MNQSYLSASCDELLSRHKKGRMNEVTKFKHLFFGKSNLRNIHFTHTSNGKRNTLCITSIECKSLTTSDCFAIVTFYLLALQTAYSPSTGR